MTHYILDDEGQPVPVEDLQSWAWWFEQAAHQVLAKTELGYAEVSTVFLGRYGGVCRAPVLWETMVFGGRHNLWHCRYTNRNDAIVGHMQTVEMVRQARRQFFARLRKRVRTR